MGDDKSLFGKETDGFGQEAMLHFENPRRDGFRCIGITYRNGFLEDDGSIIVDLVDKMDSSSRHLHAPLPNGAMNPHSIHSRPAEGGDQRGMDIQHFILELPTDFRRDQFHETCQYNQSNAGLIEGLFQ